jgi:SAM-dependent methyltransferase
MDREDWDAFGQAMYDDYHGLGGYEIIERDDGFFSLSPGPQLYLAEYAQWPEFERQAMTYARGRVLDIGCGAGRHALYLQGQGLEVTGVDVSPGAICTSQERGLRQAFVCPITQVSHRLGVFDTLLMLGNNFALLGTPRRAKWLLHRFYNMTSVQGRILAGTRNPYKTDLPEHLDYHARNRQNGRMSGQARIRARYKRLVTPWIDFLMLSPQETKEIIQGTGWQVRCFLDEDQANYIVVLEKSAHPG